MYHKEICNDHGRIETREYYVSDDIDWLLQGHSGWAGIRACAASVIEKGRTTQTMGCSIYSIAGMTAERYGRSKRAHWGIENSLHWVLDIGFREDESRIRAGNAVENMNAARHIGASLLKQEKS